MKKADQAELSGTAASGTPPTSVDLSEPAVPRAISTFRHLARDFSLSNAAGQAVADDVALAVSEAVTNVVKYAYEPQEVGVVRMAVSLVDGWLEVKIVDDGLGFREHEPDGLGVGLKVMASVSDDLDISQGAGGTEVRMRFLPEQTSR
jgi:serine/threonine-protein kinase RsbW